MSENFFKHYFFSIGHQRPTNGEYIAGENEFFGHSWRPGEPSEDRPIKHRENTFMSIKIDRSFDSGQVFFKSLVLMVARKKCALPIPAPPMSVGILDRSWKLRSLFLA